MNEEQNHQKDHQTPQPEPEPLAIPLIALSGAEEGGAGLGAKIQCALPEVPLVVLSEEALKQALTYASATELEISALGVVDRDGTIFRISRFHLVEQTSSLAGVELDPAAVGALTEELMADGKSEEAGRLRCWLHSHPDMKAFWSGTDETTCQLLGGEYLVSIVIGLHDDRPPQFLCRIDLQGVVPITLDHVPLLAEVVRNDCALEAYAEEVRKKVKPAPLPALALRRGKKGKTDIDITVDELDWFYDSDPALESERFTDPFYYGDSDDDDDWSDYK